ncbi:MAG: CBS domain-containing protein [Saprospiraceae bacterium]|nr:CBS domain-containing protein [Saprospiraceae bacterium]
MKNFQQKTATVTPNKKMHAESVRKYMARDLITFTPNTEIHEVINTLLDHRISGAPVLSETGELVGLIDDKDCLNVLIDSAYYNQPVSRNTVSQYMTNVMRTISVDADLVDVANTFVRTNFKRLLVVDDDGKLVGQVSRRDILRAIRDMRSTTWHEG